MSNTSTLFPSAPSLRQEASVIGLVGGAHMISHFSQLLLAPLFPWLKDDFHASYAELGLLMSIFFVVSCGVQMASGFVVDKFGPRPILFAGLALLGLAAFGFSMSTSYAMLAAFSVLAGIGNGVFHPVDYTLLNRKISAPRLGHAYSVHGITGSLGWALAPAMLVPLTLAFGWRSALACAGGLAFAVLAVLWLYRDRLALPVLAAGKPGTPLMEGGSLGFPAHSGGVDVLWFLLFLRHGTERGAGLCPRGGAPVAQRAAGSGGPVPDGLHAVQRGRHGAGRIFSGRPCAV